MVSLITIFKGGGGGKAYYAEIPYSGNISWEKNFTKASTRVLHENFARFYFRQCDKGRHVHCVIINTREEIHR